MILSKTIYEKVNDFAVSTLYKGTILKLNISPAGDRFAVLEGKKLIGHIKIGYDRHTWYVADSNYVAYELVNEIGRSIVDRVY